MLAPGTATPIAAARTTASTVASEPTAGATAVPTAAGHAAIAARAVQVVAHVNRRPAHVAMAAAANVIPAVLPNFGAAARHCFIARGQSAVLIAATAAVAKAIGAIGTTIRHVAILATTAATMWAATTPIPVTK